jgi:tetratricopeptide (TPR) repeat protein
LPFVLLLLDYWPLGRWTKEISAPIKSRGHLIGRLLWEKAPFIVLTILSSIVTIWAANKDGSVASMEEISFPVRIQNAILSYVSYLEKTFWPVDLAVYYPYGYFFPLWQILFSCFILIGITIVVIYALKKLPFLFVGWFWYLGTLIPVIGLVQVGYQSMADRYTYLPSIGIVIMLVWGIPLLFQRKELRKKILFPTGISALAILAVLTWQQCGYWKKSIELWDHALHVTKDNALAHNNLGLVLFAEGKLDEAVDHYNKAMRLKPDDADTFNNRGNAYAELGQYQQAVADYNEAIRLNPHYAEGYYYRGIAYAAVGQYQKAIADFNMAIRLQPDLAPIYIDRGNAYAKLGHYQRYIDDFNKAIGLKPDLAEDYYNSGNAYFAVGQYQRAIEAYNQAIRLKQDYTDAYNIRAVVYLHQGNIKLGCGDAQKACASGNCTTLEAVKSSGYCR